MASKPQLTQQEKHISFKKAFETVSAYVSNKNYIGAYVVAFSILEDRITASYLLLLDYMEKERPAVGKHIPFGDKLKALREGGVVELIDVEEYRNCAKDRNGKLHAAMWNLDAFTDGDCATVIKLARKADKLSRKIKNRQIK